MIFDAARTGKPGARSGVLRALSRARAATLRLGARGAVAALLLLAASLGRGALAEKVSAELSVDSSAGYARIVYRFGGDIDAAVRMSNGILLISFSAPVELSIERLNSAVPGYISAARRDPDGKGLRVALARKVTLHSMQANDRLFVDLLPDTWTGPPPPLPQDIVEELARRAKEAERHENQMRLLAQQKRMIETRVRVAQQPNFTRYIFELPDLVTVVAERGGDKLNLRVDAPLKFDLAEAKASLPAVIEHIDSETGDQTTTVKFTFVGKVDIRSFREDNTYIIDVSAVDPLFKRGAAPERTTSASDKLPAELEAPATVPARASMPLKENTREGAREPVKEGPKGAFTEPPAKALAKGGTPPSSQTGPFPPTMPMTFDPANEIEVANRAAAALAAPPAGVAAMGAEAVAPEVRVSPAVEPAPAQRRVKRLAAAPNAPARAEPEPPAAAASSEPAVPAGSVKAELHRQSDNLKLVFPFALPTSGAVFRRADMLWAVFDSTAAIDVEALRADPTGTIGGATILRGPDYQIVRIKLERPRLTSFTTAENSWTIAIGDTVLEPTLPVIIARNVVGASRATAVATFERPRSIRRIADPDVGDTLIVVTGFVPARGILKEQDFVEFRLLASTHGIVVQPFADDVDVELSSDKVVISRPSGLALSAANQIGHRGYRPVVLDSQSWGFDREADFTKRQTALIAAAAAAPEGKRMPPRFELARFYLAREMYAEAKGVLDVALAEDHPSAEDSTGLVMRAIAEIMMNRITEGLQDLASPLVGNNYDAQLWRALAYAKQGKWADASENFNKTETALTALPVEFQRQLMVDAVRASIETRDFAGAADKLNEFETVGVPKELEPRIAVLQGRLDEGLGRNEDALAAYRAAAEFDRPGFRRARAPPRYRAALPAWRDEAAGRRFGA